MFVGARQGSHNAVICAISSLEFSHLSSNPLRWLLLAGALHVALTTTVFVIGHFQLLPSAVDPNGIGLTFAIDGATYRRLASEMATHWRNAPFRVVNCVITHRFAS